MEYLDFEVEVAPAVGGSYAVVVRSPVGEATAAMKFPFDPAADDLALKTRLQALQIALLRGGVARRRINTPEVDAVQQFGTELWNALFTDEVLARFDEVREKAAIQGDDVGVRVKLAFDAPELSALPWEYLFDPRRGDFLTLAAHSPLVRHIPLAQPQKPLAVEPPLRILGLVVSPNDRPTLDVERERQRLEESVRELVERGLVELVWVAGQTWRDLRRAVRTQAWHVFHFIGHGGFDETRKEGIVEVADEDGNSRGLRATELARLLGDEQTLRLAVLNSCEGGRPDKADVFSSTAAVLVRHGTPAVVAMQYEITDDAAIEFSRSFYEAIVDGMPVDAALAEARIGLSVALPDTLEWGTPVLFTRTANGPLFRMPEGAIAAGAVAATTAVAGATSAGAAVAGAAGADAEPGTDEAVAEPVAEGEAEAAGSVAEPVADGGPTPAESTEAAGHGPEVVATAEVAETEPAETAPTTDTEPAEGVPVGAAEPGADRAPEPSVEDMAAGSEPAVETPPPVEPPPPVPPDWEFAERHRDADPDLAVLVGGRRPALDAASRSPAVDLDATAARPVAEPVPRPQPREVRRSTGGRGGRIGVIAAALVGLAALGIAGFAVLRGGDEGSLPPTTPPSGDVAVVGVGGAHGIVFQNRPSSSDAYDIYALPATGGEPERLTDNGVLDRNPVWSPDGTEIAFSTVTGTNREDIFVMDREGTILRRLTENAGRNWFPTWSPDGSRIAFATDRHDVKGDIWIMTRDGENEAALTAIPGREERAPAWAWSGDQIAFFGDLDVAGDADLYVIGADGGTTANILRDPIRDVTPSWSPDGRTIAFSRVPTPGRRDLFLLDVASGALTPLSEHAADEGNPVWAPNGEEILYYRGGSGRYELWTINRNGSGAERIVDMPGESIDANWR